MRYFYRTLALFVVVLTGIAFISPDRASGASAGEIDSGVGIALQELYAQ